MALRKDIPPANIGHHLLSEYAHKAFKTQREHPSRVIGITISKVRESQDFHFDEPVDLLQDTHLEELIEQRTGKTRAVWESEGFSIDVNGS